MLAGVLLLSQDEIDDLESVFENVFTDMNVAELRIFLAEILEMCMTTDNVSFALPEQRSSAILAHAALNKLVQAAWLIVKPRFDALKESEPAETPGGGDQLTHESTARDKIETHFSAMLERADNLLKLMERVVEALIALRPPAGAMLTS